MTIKHSFGSDPRAFTLVELLVSISVIAVLLATSLPALRGARESAAAVVCQSSLANIARVQQIYQGDFDDSWPNAFGPKGGAEWTVGETTTKAFSVFSQVKGWSGPLEAANRIDIRAELEALSCPAAIRQLTDELDDNPQIAPMNSFGYSPAFFTKVELWNPDRADRREDPDRWRGRVRGSSVPFPSLKVAMFEIADYHGYGDVIGSTGSPPDQKSSTSFGDGHVIRSSLSSADAALPLNWNSLYGPTTPDRLPFSSAPQGFRGRDF